MTHGEAIERVVANLLAQDESAWPSDADLARSHPDLMPELADRVTALRSIRRAAARAAGHSAASGPAQLLDRIFETDLQLLQAELSDYEILTRVQYGGQGVVYKALQRATKRVVAIKVLLDGPLATPRQRARFAREVELCSRLTHPNVVALYSSGTVHGRPYCAMEFIDGLPIDEFVFLHRPLPREIVRLIAAVCRAIHYAHQRGIIHRDLSPANLMVDLDGVPHVLDFGLAKDVWLAGGPEISQTGQVVGTLPFLSPEQISGNDTEIDVRSDVYSLGAVLFTLLSGRRPFLARSAVELRDQILHERPPRLSQVQRPDGSPVAADRDLELILLKALAAETSERYQSAEALADDLDRYIAGEAVQARAHSRLYLLRKSVRKYRWAYAGGALFLLVLIAGVTVSTAMWLEAAAQHNTATQAAAISYSLFDDLSTVFENDVRTLAGGVAVGDKLFTLVDARLSELEEVTSSDAKLLPTLTLLKEHQGDIAAAQGNRAVARACYTAFLDGARALRPQNHATRAIIARAHRKLAGIIDEAEPQYRQAVELGTAVASDGHAGFRDYAELCETHIQFARFYFLRGDYTQSADQINAALRVAETHDFESQLESGGPALFALARERESDLYFRLADAERATNALLECLRLREQLSANSPANADLRHKVLRTHSRLAQAYREQVRPELARDHLQQAIRIGEDLVFVDPTVTDWTKDLAVAHASLALELHDIPELDSAAVHCSRALDLVTRIHESDPEDLMAVDLLAGIHSYASKIALKRGSLDEALMHAQEMVALRHSLCAAAPDATTPRRKLAVDLEALGSCYHTAGDLQSAGQAYEQAFAIRRELLAARPEFVESQLDCVLSQIVLSAWLLDFDTAEADARTAAYLAQAEQTLQTLQRAGKMEGQQRRLRDWTARIQEYRVLLAEHEARRTQAPVPEQRR